MKKQADNRYRAKVTIGHDENDIPVMKWVSGRTKKELQSKKDEVERVYITGNTESVQRDILFEVYARQWMDVFKAPTLKAAGVSMYHTVLNAHLIPVFGTRQVRSITPGNLQAYLNKLAKKYSKSLISQVHLTLSQIFALATAQYIIDRNPMLTVSRPAARAGTRRELTDAETIAALYVANNHEYGLLWLLLYYTGARLGEVLGLQWSDVDFKRHSITIQRDIDYKQQGGKVGTLKTKRSMRALPIAEELFTVLKEKRGIGSSYIISAPKSGSYLPQSTAQRHVDTLRRAMYAYDNSIQHTDSPLFQRQNTRRTDKNKMKKAPQVSVITPHYFRHNFATLCYYSGVDILTAAAWLGHTSPDVIMNIYAHLDNTRGVRDASKISGIFKKVAK